MASPGLHDIVDVVAMGFNAAGVLVIVLGLLLALLRLALGRDMPQPYHQFRHDLGRGTLLGLEFMMAASVVRTVTPTSQGVLVLGLIVLIRTVLSLTLSMEMEGSWPWRRRSG